MSAPADVPLRLVLDNTMGAQLIGVLLAGILYGVSCAQTFYYLSQYPKDRWYLKLLVGACWVSDTVHQALISHTIYIYIVKNFTNPAILGKLVWSLLAEVLFNGITALLIQSFYAFRVWRLSNGNIWITVTVVALIIGEFAAVLAYTVQSLQLGTFVELAALKHLSMAVNILAAVGDVLIAGTLCTLLYWSKNGFDKSNSMINKLIAFTVNTGLLTSMCAVMSLVSIIAWPNAFIYICFYFMLGRLYSNSLLATLNARNDIRKTGSEAESYSLSTPVTFPSTKTFGGTKRRTAKPNSLRIQVETTHIVDHDKESQCTIEAPITPEDSPNISYIKDTKTSMCSRASENDIQSNYVNEVQRDKTSDWV